MSSDEQAEGEHERQLDAIIAEYYRVSDAGGVVDQNEFIQRNPNFALELKEFFADARLLHRQDHSDSTEHLLDPTVALGTSRPAKSAAGAIVKYFGEYEILEDLGVGGMGVVYKARQTKLKRIVALKMIRSGELANAMDLQRFEAEAKAAAKLSHPGIVSVHEVGIHDGQHFYTMDYVEGGNLSQLHRDEPVPVKRAVKLIRQLAESMHYAHQKGIVHRDLKPANILLTADGEPRIADFGLAKRVHDDESQSPTLTESGQILGTAGYMSPEQASGKSRLVGPLSDIYSLGAVLYALLTSRAPFVGETPSHTIMQVLQNEPISPRKLNPSVPRDLENICLKCLEKEPHKRYGTAEELADDLNRFLVGRPVIARPIGRLDKTYRWARRNPWIAATAVLLMLIGLASPLFAAREVYLRRAADDQAAFAADEAERANQEAATAKRLKQEAETNLQLANINAEAERLANVATNAALSRVKYFLALAHWDNGRVADAVAALEEIPEFDRHLEWHIAFREFQGSSATLKGHVGTVNAVVFSPDGTHVASGGSNEILIWDAGRSKILRSIKVNGIVRCLRYSRDGKELYASSGNTITIWNPASGLPLGAITEAASNEEEIWSFDLHPRQPVMVMGTRIVNKNGRLLWWNLTDGALLRSIETPRHGVRHVCFSPEGSRLGSTGFDSGLAVLDSESGEPLWKTYRDGVDLAFTPDGTAVATSKTFMGWSIHDTASGDIIQQGPTADSQRLRASTRLAFNPPGTRLAIGYTSGEIGILNKRSESKSRYQGHQGSITDVAFSPDGSMLASASEDGTVKLWDLDGSNVFAANKVIVKPSSLVRTFLEDVLMSRAEYALNDRALDATFGSSGGRLAVAGCDKDVQIWDTANMNLAQTLSGHSDIVIRVAMSQDETKLASVCVDNRIHLWDLVTEQMIHSMPGHRDLVTDLQFSPDGQRLISCDLAASVKVWSTVEGKEIFTLYGHGGPVQAIDVRDDGKNVVSVGLDGTLCVWDIDSGNLLRNIEIGGKLNDVEFLPASPVVCVGGARGEKSGLLQWWDTSSGRCVRSIEAAGSVIHSLALNHDATRLLTCENYVVKLWDVEKKQELLSRSVAGSGHSGKVLICPTKELIVIASTARYPGSGPFDLPMQRAAFTIIRGADDAINLLAHDPVPDRERPTRSKEHIDGLLANAISNHADSFATVYALGSWLRQSDESNPNHAAALNGFHAELTEWRSTMAEAHPEMPEVDTDLLLPDDARRVLENYPNRPDTTNGVAMSRRKDPGFESVFLYWYEVQKQLETAAEFKRKNEFAEARKIYQTLIDEASQKTDDPLRVVAHAPYAVTLVWLWNQLAYLEQQAAKPESRRATYEKLAEVMSKGVQKKNPRDWLTLADIWYEIEHFEKAADAYLKHLQLLDKTKLIPTDGEFCPYLRHADFQIVTRLMISRNFKPAALDGKFINDTQVYRARFEPRDGVPYYYYWGIDEAFFQRRSDEIHAQGLTMVDHFSFQNNGGKPLHCAIWEVARPSFEQDPIEGESLYVHSFDGGKAYAQDMVSFGRDKWSRGQHLLWMDAKPGNQLKLEFDLNTSGDYIVETVLTTAPDFAIVDLKLNGVVISEGIDLYRPNVVDTTGKLELGTLSLVAGRQQLVIEIKGANDSSIKKYGFGIDYIQLTSTKNDQAEVEKDAINPNTNTSPTTEMIPHDPDLITQESQPIEISSSMPKMLSDAAFQTEFIEKICLKQRPMDVFVVRDPTTSEPLYGIDWGPADGLDFIVRHKMSDELLKKHEANAIRQGFTLKRVRTVTIGGVNHHIGLWTKPDTSAQK